MAQLMMHVIYIQSASYTFMRREIDNRHFLRTLGIREPIFINYSYGDTNNTNGQLGNAFLAGGRWQPREGNIRNRDIETMYICSTYMYRHLHPHLFDFLPGLGKSTSSKSRASMATL